MTRRNGKNTDLASALGGLLGKLDRKNKGAYTTAKVSLLWEEVSGPQVAKHTTGAYLRDGVLVIYVDASAWATELTAMAERYRNSINQGLGKETVESIRFTVSRKVVEEHRFARAEQELDDFYREDLVDSLPLTETERAQVVASASVIPDDTLREAAISATIKDLEWKKGIADRNSRERARESS